MLDDALVGCFLQGVHNIVQTVARRLAPVVERRESLGQIAARMHGAPPQQRCVLD